MKKTKHIIWSSECNFEDWEEDLRAEHPEMTEAELLEEMYELNSVNLEDERLNLSDIEYADNIICIATLGLWNGTPMAYKDMKTNQVSKCLHSLCNSISDITFFVDERGDFRADEAHHDGTNHYLYRVWKDVSDIQKENFLDKVYRGVATRKDITRYTARIGADIAEVYGWRVSAIPKGEKDI